MSKKNRPAPRTGFDDPWAPEPRGSVPAAYTAAIAAALIRWPRDADGRPYDPRAEQRRLAAEGWPGTIIGGGCLPCPQCQAEERGAGAIDRTGHEHWLADKRLEERLKDATRITRGEANGEFRIGHRVGPDNRIVLDR